jgi:acyl carrier protein
MLIKLMTDSTTDNIKDVLRSFIRTRFNVPQEDADFNDDVHLFDYGYVDSFGAVDLNTYVQETFSIKVNQSDLIAFPLNTIQEIASFVAKRQSGEI